MAPFMAMVVLLMGAGGVLASLVFAIDPGSLFSLFEPIRTTEGLYFSAFGNLFWAFVLISAAPVTKYPTGFRVLGGLAALEGVVYLFLPVELWVAYLDSWMSNPTLFRLVGAPLGVIFGLFIVYGAIPRDDERQSQESA